MAEDTKKMEQRLTIKCQGEEDIELAHSDYDLEVCFKIDTIDVQVKDRADDIVNEVVILGNITPKTNASTRDLAKWALSSAYNQTYREVEIVMTKGSDERVRTYRLNKAFCVDYTEFFGRKKAYDPNGRTDYFELKLAQKADSLDEIEVIAG